MRFARTTTLALAAALLALWAGCGDDDTPTNLGGTGADADSTVAPDFALKDVNESSATHDESVSPRDYLQSVSAWYFGVAT